MVGKGGEEERGLVLVCTSINECEELEGGLSCWGDANGTYVRGWVWAFEQLQQLGG